MQGDSLSCCPADGTDDDLESVGTPSSDNSDNRARHLARAVERATESKATVSPQLLSPPLFVSWNQIASLRGLIAVHKDIESCPHDELKAALARHKVQGRLLPPREVFSGVDMGRSTSVFFFCLAMDPIFVALNQVPRVLLVAGYVDDTTIVGTQRDPDWIKEVFKLVNTWSAAGVVMDAHTCWQVGLSKIPLPEQQLLRFTDYAEAFLPWHEQGEATISAAVRHIPHYAHYFVLRHGEHCAMFHASQYQEWMRNGHPAASACR